MRWLWFCLFLSEKVLFSFVLALREKVRMRGIPFALWEKVRMRVIFPLSLWERVG